MRDCVEEQSWIPIGLALALAVLAGCDTTEPLAPVVVEKEPEGYPIHLEWWVCDYAEHCSSTLKSVEPTEYLRPAVVAGIRLGAREWSEVLARTEAEPFVVPPGDVWPCWYGVERYSPGDTLRAGLTFHIVRVLNPTNDFITAFRCGETWDGENSHILWDRGEDTKTISGGLRISHDEWLEEGTEEWRIIAMHEIGHVVGVGYSDRWFEYLQVSTNGRRAWVADPKLIAVYNRLGGAEFTGEKVQVAPDAVSHWAGCIAKPDVMSNWLWSYEEPRITELSTAALWPGFHAKAQGGLDNDANLYWSRCGEPLSDMPVMASVALQGHGRLSR